MEKQPAQDAGSAPPASDAPAPPRASGEVVKGSVLEVLLQDATPSDGGEPAVTGPEAPLAANSSDTLLSAGKPAERLELMLEDGLSQIEARLRDLDARLAVLEQKKPSKVAEPRHKPWIWLVFLVALVVLFQMLQRIR